MATDCFVSQRHDIERINKSFIYAFNIVTLDDPSALHGARHICVACFVEIAVINSMCVSVCVCVSITVSQRWFIDIITLY